jgi:hypothetical protein
MELGEPAIRLLVVALEHVVEGLVVELVHAGIQSFPDRVTRHGHGSGNSEIHHWVHQESTAVQPVRLFQPLLPLLGYPVASLLRPELRPLSVWQVGEGQIGFRKLGIEYGREPERTFRILETFLIPVSQREVVMCRGVE